MKYLYVLLLMAVSYQSEAQFVDSFKRNNQWYYTTDQRNSSIRNFYPVVRREVLFRITTGFDSKSDLFVEKDTSCNKRKTVYIQNDPILLEPCMFKLDLNVLNFGTSWGCIPMNAYNIYNFKQGEKLEYDGCYIYKRGIKPIKVEHRGFIIKSEEYKDTTFMYNGIKTTFQYINY